VPVTCGVCLKKLVLPQSQLLDYSLLDNLLIPPIPPIPPKLLMLMLNTELTLLPNGLLLSTLEEVKLKLQDSKLKLSTNLD